jgi:hypothetical protein
MKVKRLAKICVAVLTIFALWGMNPVSASEQLPSGTLEWNGSDLFPITQEMQEKGVYFTFYELTAEQDEGDTYQVPAYRVYVFKKTEDGEFIGPLSTVCGGRMPLGSQRTCTLSNFNFREGDNYYIEVMNSLVSGDPDVNYFVSYIK